MLSPYWDLGLKRASRDNNCYRQLYDCYIKIIQLESSAQKVIL